uniref:Methionine aminopeptidase n=1 Tax=Candidatus Kentrum sp. MB TaxID=2138164 RepID=A0A451B752_9GAMM|nr:MAG: methionine aminopeptidase, type I [Candidatus Kentron sp. MB]VFK28787.1 MAG: methionine aminopeptidase, type I [Candidatus Kentron sp. MB]VFK74096.1 MAG: methionine aminopeptidase, type I [Candidatus Kentron sp. MB]
MDKNKNGKQPNITLKTTAEVEKIRIAGHLAAEVLDMIGPYVKPGVTTNELDRICHDFITRDQKAVPAPLNYRGFPKSICTSVNYQVCHGIPNNKRLKNGDIINIDITIIKNGYHGDISRMFPVGSVSPAAKRLIKVSRECLWEGIRAVAPGLTLGDVGHAIQRHAERNRYSVVREYCGHGIGIDFHEDPQILHYGQPGDGELLRTGMTFTIEPMINLGKRQVKQLSDDWTVVTRDRSLSAQWEHTVLVTEDGVDILTLRPGEKW